MGGAAGAPQAAARGRPSRAADAICVVGVVVYALAGLAFACFGRLNGDEGWYLYAARLVVRGALPYADFAFPQMPLTPYVYALPQLAASSLLVGRLTSLALALGALALNLRSARRLGGAPAAAAVAALLAAFPVGIYYLVLAKTYALAAFWLAVVLAALTSDARRDVALPAAVGAAFALTLTRTSGAPVALLVLAFALWRDASARGRRRNGVVALAGVATLAFFVLSHPASARYHLLSVHQIWWYGAPLATRLAVILGERVPECLRAYPGYALGALAALAAAALSPAARARLRAQPGIAVFFVGAAAFAATHLTPGQFGAVEYMTAVVPAVATACVVTLAAALLSPGSRRGPRAFALATAAVALSTLAWPSARGLLVAPGAPGSIAASDAIATFVRAHTRPDEAILAFWCQDVAVAADRGLVPGASVGILSYEDMPRARAESLHYLDADMLEALLRTGRPAAVVLSDLDWRVFRRAGALSKRPGDPEAIRKALLARYQPAFAGVGFGLVRPLAVEVYVRRPAAD